MRFLGGVLGLRTRLLVVLLLLLMACSGSGSCGGGATCSGCSGTYRYPRNDSTRPDAILQSEAARVRITQGFLDYVRPRLPAILKAKLAGQNGITVDADDVLHIPIPDQNLFDIGVAEARMRNAEALLWLNDIDQRFDIRFEEPSGVRLTFVNMRLGVMLDLKEDVLGTTSSCPIEGDLGPLGPGPLSHAAEISISALIDPGVGPDPLRNLDIRVMVDNVALDDLDIHVSGNYCSESECRDCLVEVFGTCLDIGGRCTECHIFCGGITNGLLSLITGLIDLVRPLLEGILQPIIQDMLGDTLNSLNGTSTKLETEVSVADLIQLDALARAQPFGMFAAPDPGRFSVINRGTGPGMEITATGGAEARLADCISNPPAFAMSKGPVPILGGTDSKGRPYHAGASIASSLLNQLLYAVHRSGSLCLLLTSEDVRDLTRGRFTLNASLLSILAADLSKIATDRAPVMIELKPRRAPTLSLGSGAKIGQDASGNDLFDWLLKLKLQELGLAFHVLVEDRFVRVFEVTTDINVGLNITVLPDNRLEVAVGDLRIDNFEETFNELLPNADFAMVLPTLVDIAMQALLQNQLTFDLNISNAVSDALGGVPIFLRVNEIQRDGPAQDYLTLTITFTDTATANLSLSAETIATLNHDDALLDRIDSRALPSGRARISVGEGLSYSTQRALEYQARVDGGLWRVARGARPDGTILVEDPHLLIAGRHEVEVRARFEDDYQSLDPTPAVVEAVVDPFGPSVRARVRGEMLKVRIEDDLSTGGELRLFGRLPGGQWSEIPTVADSTAAATAEVPVATFGLQARGLELRASDASGNESEVVAVSLGGGAGGGGEDGSDVSAGACGCRVSSGMHSAHAEGSMPAWPIFFLMLMAIVRRRAQIG